MLLDEATDAGDGGLDVLLRLGAELLVGALERGVAGDAGAAYVTDQRAGRLVRIAPDGSTSEDLLTGLSAPANVEFGVGALSSRSLVPVAPRW